jgi:hypothetical protein
MSRPVVAAPRTTRRDIVAVDVDAATAVATMSSLDGVVP